MTKTAIDLAREEWRPVVGFEGVYEVSDLGNVRSIDRTVTYDHKGSKLTRTFPGVVLKPAIDPKGYPRVSLKHKGGGGTRPVHRLVLMAFHGLPFEGAHGAHLNGDSTDARLVNLKWVTASENNNHKKLHGTLAEGDTHGSSKLTSQDVVAIRDQYRPFQRTHAEIAAEYGVDTGTIHQILRGKTWRSAGGRIWTKAEVHALRHLKKPFKRAGRFTKLRLAREAAALAFLTEQSQ